MLNIDFLPANTLTVLILLLIAFVLSAIIGIERQFHRKNAGLRTHTLVGLGSAVFTLVSAYGFYTVISPDIILDPSRIAAQIVSGIGFLGAGVIFVRQNIVNGLTTAASIWMTAAIGMACGAGMPLVAVVATALHLLTVTLLAKAVSRFITGRVSRGDTIVVRYMQDTGVIRKLLAKATELGFVTSLDGTSKENSDGPGEHVQASLTFRRGYVSLESLAEALSEIKGVISLNLTDEENE